MQGLKVYSRQGCHLCELLLEELLPMVRGRLSVEICDIDSRSDWQEKYTARVPVVEYRNGIVCEYRLDRDAILGLLDPPPGQPQHDAK